MAQRIIKFDGVENGALLSGLEAPHVRRIAKGCGVMVAMVEGGLKIEGRSEQVEKALAAFARIGADLAAGGTLENRLLDAAITFACHNPDRFKARNLGKTAVKVAPAEEGSAISRSAGQARYVRAMDTHELVLCSGPAGTGKTHLAMAVALACLERGRMKRLILSSPLPGDLSRAGIPLRAAWQSLASIAGEERLTAMLDAGQVGAGPIGELRGQTLKDSFVFLEDAHAATLGELRLFMTRLGQGSKFVLAGDAGDHLATDGWKAVCAALQEVGGLSVVTMDDGDIARHPLIAGILRSINAYQPS